MRHGLEPPSSSGDKYAPASGRVALECEVMGVRLQNFRPFAIAALAAAGAAALLMSRASDRPLVSRSPFDAISPGMPIAACGSSAAAPSQASCAASGSPSITFAWVNGGNPSGTACSGAILDVNGRTIERNLPCSGTYTWNGAGPAQTYAYAISYANDGHVIHSGTVRTPACASTGGGGVGPGGGSPGGSPPASPPPSGGGPPPAAPPGSGTPPGAPPTPSPLGLAQCSDGIDNDADGQVDFVTSSRRAGRPADASCSGLQDNSERNPPSVIEIPPE